MVGFASGAEGRERWLRSQQAMAQGIGQSHVRGIYRASNNLRSMFEAIRARRAIRSGYTGEPVGPDVLDRVISAGLLAPSSKNAQPWCLHVVSDPDLRAPLADAVQHAKNAATYVPVDPATGRAHLDWSSTVAESAHALRTASVAIFIENRGRFSGGRANIARSDDDVREDALVGYGFEMIGLGAAIENMWLAAVAQGLGAVFMGDVLVAESAIRTRLGIHGDLVGVLVMGPSEGEPHPQQRANDRVVFHG